MGHLIANGRLLPMDPTVNWDVSRGSGKSPTHLLLMCCLWKSLLGVDRVVHEHPQLQAPYLVSLKSNLWRIVPDHMYFVLSTVECDVLLLTTKLKRELMYLSHLCLHAPLPLLLTVCFLFPPKGNKHSFSYIFVYTLMAKTISTCQKYVSWFAHMNFSAVCLFAHW
jgi:hypothetical protein